ncbi:hypothetical protein M1O29_01015 [Dehalococcoidia bacterium]|nr:hypothetical protein [Dehalococcoidia bacterium]
MSVSETLNYLDGSLDPIVTAILAALALVGVMFAHSMGEPNQPFQQVGKQFSRALGLFIAAVVVDVVIFPTLQSLVTATVADVNLEGNFTAILVDTGSQYVLFTGGIVWMTLGGMSLARSYGLCLLNPIHYVLPNSSGPSGELPYRFGEPSQWHKDILRVLRDAEGALSSREIADLVGGAALSRFQKEMYWLRKYRYLTRERHGNITVYRLTGAGQRVAST